MEKPWIELSIQSDGGGGLSGQLSSGSGQRTPARPIEGLSIDDLRRFTRRVRRLAHRGEPLQRKDSDQAKALYSGLFDRERSRLVEQLRGARRPVLIKLMISEPALRGIPWEAMREAEGGIELACSAELQVVRGVFSRHPALPREVNGAVKLLVVAPGEIAGSVADLRAGLDDAIASGQIQWLEPAVGRAARWDLLLRRLRQAPWPHILHIICHGRYTDRPELKLDDGWRDVAVLSEALSSSEELRLIYLESCSTADPGGSESHGSLASAADVLASRGVEAVVAHLWRVDARAARDLARDFYHALTGPSAGDLAAALNAARLAERGRNRLEFLCPILTLRGTDPVLFDFSGRRAPLAVEEAGRVEALSDAQRALLQEIRGALARPCSILVGEYADPESRREELEQLWPRMKDHVQSKEQERLPLLMQRYELTRKRIKLTSLFERVLAKQHLEIPHVISGLARLSGPGLYLTLLWMPLFEQALIHHHPDDELLVFLPLEPGRTKLKDFDVYYHPPGGPWEECDPPPRQLDFSKQRVVLRMYGGYILNSRSVVGEPVLTEDDHLERLFSIGDLSEEFLSFLRNNPLHAIGFSPLDWNHRGLMRALTDRQPLRPDSFAVLSPAPSEAERNYWGSVMGRNVRTIEFDAMRAAMRAVASQRGGDER